MTIDLSRPEKHRITELKVNTGSTFEDIDDEKIYKIATVNYLANGGDGYDVILNNKLLQLEGISFLYERDFVILKNYLRSIGYRCPH